MCMHIVPGKQAKGANATQGEKSRKTKDSKHYCVLHGNITTAAHFTVSNTTGAQEHRCCARILNTKPQCSSSIRRNNKLPSPSAHVKTESQHSPLSVKTRICPQEVMQ